MSIDGACVKHSLSTSDRLFEVSCNLPCSYQIGRVGIKIFAPASHGPMDLGDIGDGRKLEITINEIPPVKPESSFGTLLKRLKAA